MVIKLSTLDIDYFDEIPLYHNEKIMIRLTKSTFMKLYYDLFNKLY